MFDFKDCEKCKRVCNVHDRHCVECGNPFLEGNTASDELVSLNSRNEKKVSARLWVLMLAIGLLAISLPFLLPEETGVLPEEIELVIAPLDSHKPSSDNDANEATDEPASPKDGSDVVKDERQSRIAWMMARSMRVAQSKERFALSEGVTESAEVLNEKHKVNSPINYYQLVKSKVLASNVSQDFINKVNGMFDFSSNSLTPQTSLMYLEPFLPREKNGDVLNLLSDADAMLLEGRERQDIGRISVALNLYEKLIEYKELSEFSLIRILNGMRNSCFLILDSFVFEGNGGVGVPLSDPVWGHISGALREESNAPVLRALEEADSLYISGKNLTKNGKANAAAKMFMQSYKKYKSVFNNKKTAALVSRLKGANGGWMATAPLVIRYERLHDSNSMETKKDNKKFLEGFLALWEEVVLHEKEMQEKLSAYSEELRVQYESCVERYILTNPKALVNTRFYPKST